MPGASDGRSRDVTVAALRERVGRDRLEVVIDELAAERVRWAGPGPGGVCRSRADVQRTLRRQVESGVRLCLRSVRPAGPRVVLEVSLSSGDVGEVSVWVVATLDAVGRIVELQDYPDETAADHDLALRGTGETRTPPGSGVGRLAPLVRVSDVVRSVSFYGLLGFDVSASHEEDGVLRWVALEAGQSSVMLSQADGAVDPGADTVVLYLYAHDLAELRDHLVAHDATVGPIIDGTPGPREQMRVSDPDGYCLMVALPRSTA